MENKDRKTLFEHVTNLEYQLGEMQKQIGNIKEHIAHLVEENHHLLTENNQLKRRLEDVIVESNGEESSTNHSLQESRQLMVGEGYDNLARLYHEGFHICHTHFGNLRTEGDCLFCLSLLKK